MNIARSGSENFLNFLGDHKVDLTNLIDINIARKIVQSRFAITDYEFTSVDFIFWISYYIEREAKDLIITPEINVGIIPERIQYIRELFSKEDEVELNRYFINVLNIKLEMTERKRALETIIDNLYFSGKIKIIEAFYSNAEDPFIKIMKITKNLRNDISHGRIHNLTYKTFPLSHGSGQLKFITDLMNSLLTKN